MTQLYSVYTAIDTHCCTSEDDRLQHGQLSLRLLRAIDAREAAIAVAILRGGQTTADSKVHLYSNVCEAMYGSMRTIFFSFGYETGLALTLLRRHDHMALVA